MEKDLVDRIMDELVDAKTEYKTIELEDDTYKQNYQRMKKQY